MPKVSIIIPVYNAEKTLRKTLISVQKQTLTDYELILVNDGSKDNSGAICDAAAKKDERIKVVHQPNQGPVAARRNGLAAACGEYICFCDADDEMPPRALELLYAPCEQGADIVTGVTERLWRKAHFPARHNPPCFTAHGGRMIGCEEFMRDLYCSWFGISNVPVSLCAKMFRREIIAEAYEKVARFDAGFFGEDLRVTLNAFPLAKNIYFLPETVYHYRFGGGTSDYKPKFLEDFLSLYRYKMKAAEAYDVPQDLRYLSDIELCNVAFSYFDMLHQAKECSAEVLRVKIAETLEKPELAAALQTEKLQKSTSHRVELLRSGDAEAIAAEVECRKKSVVKELIKKFVYATA